MLRCPFNNFSKCDGSCPFSMQDFASCRLATALIAIEGIARGQVAQATTTNAHLVEVKEKLDAIATKDGGESKMRSVCGHPEQPRLMLTSANNTRLIIPNEMGNLIWAGLGERVSYSITGHGEVLVFAGKDRKLSTHGSKSEGTRSISLQSDVGRLTEMFPDARIVYMRMEAHDGIYCFAPTEERE